MNDTSVHTILAAISEAKLALDREPEYKGRIAELETQLSQSQFHAQQLELNCANYNLRLDELQSKVRSLEVERDDASFRNLELEDKVNNLALLVTNYSGNLASMVYDLKLELKKLNPEPEPEPEVKVEPVVEPVNTENPVTGYPFSAIVGERASPLPPSTTPSAPMMEAMPTSVSSVQEPSSVSDTSTELPYKGKNYTQVFGDPPVNGCNLEDWVKNGGGAYDGSYWR